MSDVESSDALLAAQCRFRLKASDDVVSAAQKKEEKEKLFRIVKQQNNVHYYELVCGELGWEVDAALVEEMKTSNAATAATIEEKLNDAKENLGENEVREAMLLKAQFLAKTGDKDAALTVFDAVLSHPKITTGQKMDVVFAVIRLGLFWEDLALVEKNIEKASKLIEEGGDWERRNRLKVYEATFNMIIRNFSKSASLFLDSISTFTAVELFDYETFVFYTVLTSVVSLDRQTLKSRVIESPEVLQVVHANTSLLHFLNSLYNCEYKQFFNALVDVVDLLRRDRFVFNHARYVLRECRVVAYKQYLQSYKSVRIQSMARSFGIGVDFLDRELGDFVSSGRLSCKIDKVNGIVESNRPDSKNALYQQAIKQGDLLLNRIQKLSKVITL